VGGTLIALALAACLHRVSKNPAAKGKARVIAVILHPREAKLPVLAEPKKE